MMEVVRSRLKREDKGRSETLRLTFRIYERRSHNKHLRKGSIKAIVLFVISFLHVVMYQLYPLLLAIPAVSFLSDPSPIFGYACHSLSELTD